MSELTKVKLEGKELEYHTFFCLRPGYPLCSSCQAQIDEIARLLVEKWRKRAWQPHQNET